MEKRIVDILNAVNARFYRDHAESFSQTRQNPWEGWFPIGEALDALAETARASGCAGMVLTCKECMIPYYRRFGFVNEGISSSVHGGAVWYQMRRVFT